MLICIALFIVFLLQTLDFSECVIEHIDRKAFGNLGNSIETISLKGNKLRSLQVFRDVLRMQTHLMKSFTKIHSAWEIQLAVIKTFTAAPVLSPSIDCEQKTFGLNYSVQI